MKSNNATTDLVDHSAFNKKMSRGDAIFALFVSTLGGAVIGFTCAAFLNGATRPPEGPSFYRLLALG